MADGKNWGRQQGWAQKVVDLSQGMSASEEWPHILRTVANTLGVNAAPPPEPDLRIPEVYLDFSPGAAFRNISL